MTQNDLQRHIKNARDILVGKVPDPKSQVDQITLALMYKFIDDMDQNAEEMDGQPTFFTGDYKKYSWRHLLDVKLGNQERMNLYDEALKKLPFNENLPPLFREIFKDAFLPYRDPNTLSLFLKEINYFSYDNSENLGSAFEHLLSVMSSQGDAGQFRTPRHIIDFIVAAVNPQKTDTILDPACGTAGFLISAFKHILKTNDNKLSPDERKRISDSFAGYDISPDMVRLSLVNLYLHGFKQPKIFEYDTLGSDSKWNEFYDVILANPPFMTPRGGIKPHARFEVRANRSEVLFVDYIMEHLTPSGRAGVIVPEGIIFQSANAYKALRKMLVENNYLYAVVSLPAGVFNPYAGVKTSVLLMDRVLARKSKGVLFVKIQNDGFDLGAQRRPIEKNDLTEALQLIKQFQQNPEQEIKSDLAHVVTKAKIAEPGDYNLSGDRYKETVNLVNQKWSTISLDEVINLNFGVRITKQNNKGTLYPVYGGGGESFRTNTFNRENEVVISRFAMSENCARFVGGKFYLLDSGFTFSVKPEKESEVLKSFVDKYLLSIQSKIYECSRGHAQKNLDVKQFQGIKIPLPQTEVQKQIVEEIDSYQKIIEGAKQVITNWKPKIKIDPEWKKVKIKEVCETTSGGTPLKSKTEYYSDGTIPWLRSGEVAQGFIRQSKLLITKKGLKNSSAKLLPVDTVLVAMYGATAGQVGILKFESTTNQAICGVLPNRKFIPEFLFQALKDQKETMINLAGGGAQPNISQNVIRNLEIPLPSLEIQKQIVTKIEAERELVEANKKLIKIMEEKIKKVIDEI